MSLTVKNTSECLDNLLSRRENYTKYVSEFMNQCSDVDESIILFPFQWKFGENDTLKFPISFHIRKINTTIIWGSIRTSYYNYQSDIDFDDDDYVDHRQLDGFL